ncbi:MAG TPA: type IV toxin-antitoxin system AbiEi family antitoxin domain-containing protein [Nocardioidaceae bacterium]|nr:type IV toxin-antitoxin system AbiEi family antitoxin domain-containing protein [Nocardioidaceae bacterium]
MDRLRILAQANGCFTRTQALQVGLDDNAIRLALKIGLWTRVRWGVYTFTDLWTEQDEVARHLAAARSVARKLGPSVALSHVSAALDHGLLVWDADLSTVHVTRLDGGAGRTEAGVTHHEGFCVDSDVIEKDGYLLVKPVRAALESAAMTSSEAAVVTLDSGLHLNRFTPAELDENFALMQHWPGALHLQFAVRFADARAESVGESRARYLCYAHGLPAPELQFHVYDERGILAGITDMVWREHRLLGEFDGKVKYGRLLMPGEEPGEAVFREKRREDNLRRLTDFSMIRLTWADLYRGAETAARIRGLMRRAA